MTDYLNHIVEGVKRNLNAKADDYVTVQIVVLIGKKEEVIEAEDTIYSSIDIADLPCKGARIKMTNWKGKPKKGL